MLNLLEAFTDERRARPRFVPLDCRLRLCVPEGCICHTCQRPVFREENPRSLFTPPLDHFRPTENHELENI